MGTVNMGGIEVEEGCSRGFIADIEILRSGSQVIDDLPSKKGLAKARFR